MKSIDKMPVSKVSRAAKFLNTGVKIGGNYLKHYSKSIVTGDHSKDALHENNSETVYDALSKLKGSALKVAQMLSMDKNLLPGAYQQKFAMSQYSAPPLSSPLVAKIFKEYFGKSPDTIFDQFDKEAKNAASIGQVHTAYLDNKKLAVKVQYPGVANSVTADLKLVKPIALRLFNLNEAELNEYMQEVETKLLEETDYDLELAQSLELSEKSMDLDGIVFPQYYPEYSSKRVLTMDWIEGMHLDEFLLKNNPDQDTRNKLGQYLWDFINFQVHELRKVHADPHPGNFLFTEDNKLAVIDFGCVKEIPDEFYYPYFGLLNKESLADDTYLLKVFEELGFIYKNDTKKEREFFFNTFKDLLSHLGKPIFNKSFDFGDDQYFKELFEVGDKISRSTEFRSSKKARGSRHGLYINRTYFGLYNLLNQLGAKIETQNKNYSLPEPVH